MVASVTTQELKEDLASVNASVGDLVGAGEAEAMARKTWYFGESLITERMIKKMKKEGYFSTGRAEPWPAGEMEPSLGEGYAMVFRDYFYCSLRLPSIKFLHEVLEEFQLQIH
jgi:hypothetical protein